MNGIAITINDQQVEVEPSKSFLVLFIAHKRRVATWLVVMSSRQKITRSEIKPPNTPFGFGYLSTIMH
jgi:hypothetical protein